MRFFFGLLIHLLYRPVIALVLIGVALAWWSNAHISKRSAEYLYDNVDLVPHNHVGLVLGTSEKVRGGQPNLYFVNRIKAAAELYHNGKVDRLLVSGDNGTVYYNEPWVMRKALIAAGVDSSHITLDYAGFRTLDSMVRGKAVFGQQRFTVISQRFHTERAVFIARRKGIEAIGYNAADVGVQRGFRTQLREKAARIKVFFDLALGVEPRFYGAPIPLEGDTPLDPELHLE